MQTLFIALDAIYYSAAKCSAALGITRQAYHQARTRRRLSDRVAIRAAALLNIDPGQALLINATGQHPDFPINHPAPQPPNNPPRQPPINAASHALYYVKYCGNKNSYKKTQKTKKITHFLPPANRAKCHVPKKMADSAKCRKHRAQPTGIISAVQKISPHDLPISDKRKFAIDCVEWMLCVPKIPPDSPRFTHYFSRWLVPEKIASAKANGTFAESVKSCPLYSPSLIDYIQPGIDEYEKFSRKKILHATLKTHSKTLVNLSTIAA